LLLVLDITDIVVKLITMFLLYINYLINSIKNLLSNNISQCNICCVGMHACLHVMHVFMCMHGNGSAFYIWMYRRYNV